MNRKILYLIALISIFTLSGCGGGGGSASSSSSGGGDNVDDGSGEPVDEVQGQINLSWTAPSSRMDGTPLAISEIDGYTIYIGNSQSSLQATLETDQSSASIKNLEPGTYYLAVTVTDSEGLESGYSQIISKEII
jgi:hypothetical protein